MEKYNVTNLSMNIKRVIGDKRNQTIIRFEVKNYIMPRIEILNKKAKYFIFEDSYVETEWKDMISIHYINTSYLTQSTVMRVHLFANDEYSEVSYLGFFTLRKIDEIGHMLSFIYPNLSKFKTSEETYIMAYSRNVHVGGKIFSIKTYPLLVQDSMVISCAQSALISMSKYLHYKYQYNCIRVFDLNQNYLYARKRAFPSNGLDALQMLEILNNYNIGVDYNVIDMDNPEKSRQYIEYTLESALPVILGITFEKKGEYVGHILQIVGHEGLGDKKKYIIYDDSGCFVEKLRGKRDFMGAFSWEEIVSEMEGESNFIIYPIFDRVYTLYDDIEIITSDIREYDGIKDMLEGVKTKNNRYFLIDNVKIKEHIYATMGYEVFESMPHYMWCSETQLDEDSYLYFIIDPTYHAKTTKIVIRMAYVSEIQIKLLDIL